MAVLIQTDGKQSDVLPLEPEAGFRVDEVISLLGTGFDIILLNSEVAMIVPAPNQKATMVLRHVTLDPTREVHGSVLLVNREDLCLEDFGLKPDGKQQY